MSKKNKGKHLVKPLPLYLGETNSFQINPSTPPNGDHRGDMILSSLLIDDVEYDDAIRVRVKTAGVPFDFYMDAGGTEALIEMLSRDLLKLRAIDAIDPE